MPVSIQMAEYGSTMATRQRGSELRAEIQTVIGDIGQVVLDFQGVLSISNSFADEFFGPMAVGGIGPKFEPINARDEVQRVIDRVLDRRRRIAAGNLPMPTEFTSF